VNEELLQRLERAAERITLDMPASLDDREFTQVFNLEFARLIVEECCDLIYDRGEHSDGSVTKYKIRKHFGLVE
jgi:hypothetical protein